jgi:hypothetical protein
MMEKCSLRLCAQSSYEQAAKNLRMLMGMEVGHSNLHRLVQKTVLPASQAEKKVTAASIDGGKIRVQSKDSRTGKWQDYKVVSLHDSHCEAFFQMPEALKQWSEAQPLSPIFTCLGDGHDGVWNVVGIFGGKAIKLKREVLDWFHLVENLYKVDAPKTHLEQVKSLLWLGKVDLAITEFEGMKQHQAQCFQNYLRKHRHRIPCYGKYQSLGIPIGSGSVESKIKQIASRVKIAGAIWKAENVPRILRLRTAYLNEASSLSISA